MPTGLHSKKKEDSLLVETPAGGRSEKPKVTAVRVLVAGAIGLSQTLWIAAAVTLVSIGALIAAPSVRQLRRLDEPELEPSAL